MKKISNKERLEIYENFFTHLHFLRYIAGNERKVLEMLAISDKVAASRATHDAAGRPLTEEQINTNINEALVAMRKLP